MASYSNALQRSRPRTPSSTSQQNYTNANVTESDTSNQHRLRTDIKSRSGERFSTSDYIMEMQQENEALRGELQSKESKLLSTMEGIKTYWVPELKNERAMRKEENAKTSTLRAQLKQSQDDNQNLQLMVQSLQDEVRAQRELNQHLQEDGSGFQMKDFSYTMGGYAVDTKILQEEVDRLSKENEILQNTMEEMEMRLDSQKQTLDTRDESITKLLELFQDKTFSDNEDMNSELDSLKMQIVEAEAKLVQLDTMLMEKNCEIIDLKKEISSASFPPETKRIQSLQAMINLKDGKLAALERELNLLEEEMALMKCGRNTINDGREEDLKQLDLLKSHSSYMKSKIEQLTRDLQKKETSLATLQTKLDTLNNQQSDSRQHIDVLKESLAAKEQRAAVLQAEVDSLRTRLDEKQHILDRKQEQLSVMQEERSTSGSDLARLQETLGVKDQKLLVLQRKIESLAEVVKEKDKELEIIKERLTNFQKDSSTNESALHTMEDALMEKEKTIKILQKELKAGEQKWRSQTARFEQEQKNLILNCNNLKQELSEKDASLSDIKEHASALASTNLKKDSQIKQMEISLQQLREKLSHNEVQLKKVEDDLRSTSMQAEVESNRVKLDNEKKLEIAENIAKEKEEELKKFQSDQDRLLNILGQTENEKNDKDKRLITLDRQLKDQQVRIKSLQTKLVEEAKLKGAAHSKDTAQFLTQIKMKDERIEELEEALRQSVRITHERESVLLKEQQNIQKLRLQQEEVNKKVNDGQLALVEARSKLSSAEEVLQEREKTIHSLLVERKKRMEESLEMKQEALLSAISEKDANIALLELSASKKRANQEEVQTLKKEKDHLVNQLKQQTQNRLKLMQGDYFEAIPHSTHKRTSSPRQKRRSHASPNSRRKNPNGQHSASEEEEGIWA